MSTCLGTGICKKHRTIDGGGTINILFQGIVCEGRSFLSTPHILSFLHDAAREQELDLA
jgi:hypothetical protein